MIICCDIDNVLNNLTEQALNVYNSRFGKNIQMSDLTAYNFCECLAKEDEEGLMKLFNEKELWDSLKPIRNSQWGVKTLIELGHKLIFATATSPVNFAWKCNWMQEYFPFVNTNDIVRVRDKSIIKCDIMIDDALHQLTSNICERVCLDYYWNHDEIKDYVCDIYRAKSWKDIINIINQIERKLEKYE